MSSKAQYWNVHRTMKGKTRNDRKIHVIITTLILSHECKAERYY